MSARRGRPRRDVPDRGEFVTTWDFPRRPRWRARGRCLTQDDPHPVVRLLRVLRAARPGRPVVLNGFERADLLAGMLLSRLRPGVPVVMVDCTWQQGPRRLDRWVTRAGVRVLSGPRTTFCVSSAQEARLWPTVWGVDPEHVAVLHWHHGVDEPEKPVRDGDGTVFTGGRALRDYAPVREAAELLDVPVRIASDALPGGDALPANVTVGRIPRSEFHERLATAGAVVVSLRDDVRSAGQTTYLDAMALGGLVVVSDTMGVREHVEDGCTGLVFPAGDGAALARRVRWVLDPANAAQVRRIREAACHWARTEFSPEAFVARLLCIVEEAAGTVPKSRS